MSDETEWPEGTAVSALLVGSIFRHGEIGIYHSDETRTTGDLLAGNIDVIVISQPPLPRETRGPCDAIARITGVSVTGM